MKSKEAIPNPFGRNLIILAILLVAFAFRCSGLDYQELRGDEAFGYFFSLPNYGEIVDQTLELHEPHPIASYWLQHLWLNVAGHSEFALRFLGVWWGVVAVALMTPLAARLELSKPAGLVAAALLALSPYAIWHAQDARMYSMSLALTMASTLLAIQFWRENSRVSQIWSALGYVAVTWLALHTHYFAVYVVVAQNIALIGWALASHDWRKLALWWGLGFLLFFAWLPWVVTAWSILVAYHGNGDSPALVNALLRAQSAFGVGESGTNQLQTWWALAGLATIGLGIATLWRMPSRSGRATLWFLLVYWLLPLAATWLSAQSRPIFNERYLIAIVPPVYLMMAAAVGEFRTGAGWSAWLGRAAVAVVVVGMLLGVIRQANDPLYSKTRGWRELAATLETLTTGAEPQEVRLVQNYPDPTLWYYYQGEVRHLVLPPNAKQVEQSKAEVKNMVESGVDTVLLVEQPSDSWDSSGIAQEALGEQFELAATQTVARWPVSIWLRPTAELEPLRVNYENGLQLSGALVTPTLALPGGMVEVELRWQGEESSGATQEAVSLQLLDSIGALAAQSDRPLLMASGPTTLVATYAILVPSTLPEGDYQLFVVVYDPSQEGAPRVMTVGGGDKQLLAKIKVDAPPRE